MSKIIMKYATKKEKHGLYYGTTKLNEVRLLVFKHGKLICQFEILSSGKLNTQYNSCEELYTNITPIKNIDFIIEV